MDYLHHYQHPAAFELPVSTRIIMEAAALLNVQVQILDERSGFLLRLHFGDRFVTLNSLTFSVNDQRSYSLSKDKVYTYILLWRAGVKVPRGDYFFRPDYFQEVDYGSGKGLNEAISYARSLVELSGYPIIVKPNHLSFGIGITKVTTESALLPAVRRVFSLPQKEVIAIIQEYISGEEYRLLFLDDELILAYRKEFLTITGDGVTDIRSLIETKNQSLKRENRIELDSDDLKNMLAVEALSLGSVLEHGREFVLNDGNANLSRGGRAHDITSSVHPSYINLCRRICAELGLRYAGIDLKCSDITLDASKGTVLEVNGNPVLRSYYKQGNEDRVRAIYARIICSMLGLDSRRTICY